MISSTPDGKGVCVNYVDLVTQTIEAQIKAAGLDCVLPNDKTEVMLKHGCDGAGCQTVWKSTKMNASAPNMFVYGIIPLRITINSQETWKNPPPNSPDYLRPVYLIREKENDEDLISYVISSTDTEENNYMKMAYV